MGKRRILNSVVKDKPLAEPQREIRANEIMYDQQYKNESDQTVDSQLGEIPESEQCDNQD